jgi:hypothetical protein
MKTRFLWRGIWAEITRLARKSRGRAAVAYCGTGARRLLPLKSGSVLVVDARDAVVKAGLTNPTELMKFVRAGVRVYSASFLHAKVFVFGATTIVGSTNVSRSSATKLTEAAMVLGDQRTSADARAFIDGLLGEKLEMPILRELAKIYRPPRAPNEREGGRSSRRKPPLGRPLWAVALHYEDWDDVVDEKADAARPRARKEIDRRRDELHEFHWEGRLVDQLEVRDQVIQVLHEGSHRSVYPPAHVVHIKSFRRRNKRQKEMIVFLAVPKDSRTIPGSTALDRLGRRHAAWLRKLSMSRQIRDPEQAHAARRLWHSR